MEDGGAAHLASDITISIWFIMYYLNMVAAACAVHKPIKPWQRTTLVRAWVNAIHTGSLRACSPQY